MVEAKNNENNLYANFDKDKFVNKNIGGTFQNLENQIYKIIKDQITWHEIKMGERIFDKNIAERLGVSRSIVRPVLTILTKEELLVMIPRKGFYIREITKKEIEGIYNVRQVLESYATELAVPRINDIEINRLETVFKKAKSDLKLNKVKSFIEADSALHLLLISNCGNKYLKKIISKYNDRYVFYRIIDLSKIERARESFFEHYEIFKAIKEKKSKLAATLMAKHIEDAKHIILNNFEEYTYGDVNIIEKPIDLYKT